MAGEAILVIDDDPPNAKLARVLLESDGYVVETAGSAEEALRVLARFTPRLILMDIRLPGIDGLALTRRLKADPAFGRIIVVALTACAMKGDEAEARAAGCEDYITKPLDPETFLGRLARHLER